MGYQGIATVGSRQARPKVEMMFGGRIDGFHTAASIWLAWCVVERARLCS